MENLNAVNEQPSELIVLNNTVLGDMQFCRQLYNRMLYFLLHGSDKFMGSRITKNVLYLTKEYSHHKELYFWENLSRDPYYISGS